MSLVQAAPPAPAPVELPRQAVTQEEAQAISDSFELEDVDHIQVSWVDGHKGRRQALLWPIKTKWLGYMMVFLLIVVRGTRPALAPMTAGYAPTAGRKAPVTLMVTT